MTDAARHDLLRSHPSELRCIDKIRITRYIPVADIRGVCAGLRDGGIRKRLRVCLSVNGANNRSVRVVSWIRAWIQEVKD